MSSLLFCQLHLLQELKRRMLPSVLRLLCDPRVGDQVPQVLSKLLEGSPAVQSAAADANAVQRLAKHLQNPQCPPPLKARSDV